MIAKLMVMLAALAALWIISKLLVKIRAQGTELNRRREAEVQQRQAEAIREDRARAEREADIIDLEEDPETGDFRERR
ncbi:hypothetical protein [Cohaesibacter haloalkalitolerans]|uniref:hypothetical protein n=1 Tax=Cohaesibacter haloalkalitolerans TaxID=1162980 RepID=UPI000E65B12C|nr:hypothetical protein [Cohaesibacter haloalkalitolerans]